MGRIGGNLIIFVKGENLRNMEVDLEINPNIFINWIYYDKSIDMIWDDHILCNVFDLHKFKILGIPNQDTNRCQFWNPLATRDLGVLTLQMEKI